MITETSAVKFRQNLGEMINQVQYRHDSVLIKKDGKPVAAWWMRVCSIEFGGWKPASKP